MPKVISVIVGAIGLVPLLIAASQTPATQSPAGPMPDWQVAAGGRMEFDVASVKHNPHPWSLETSHANFPLEAGNGYTSDSGHLIVTDFYLRIFIGFAYKLTTYQSQFLDSTLPKWATTELFDIEARADGKPTKDQMRSMMQSLLADRFKLAVHFETRQLPVFELVLSKPGNRGPQLMPNTDESPCTTLPPPGPQVPKSSDNLWYPCDNVGGRFTSGGRLDMGGRKLTTERLAGVLVNLGGLDRPVVDRTGLSGKFDFSMQFTREDGDAQPNQQPEIAPPDETGPTFLQALQEQLGLKLKSSTGPVEVLIIDYVEQPSEN